MIRETAEEMNIALHELMQTTFEPEEIDKRKKTLGELYSNRKNAEKMLPLLYAVSG